MGHVVLFRYTLISDICVATYSSTEIVQYIETDELRIRFNMNYKRVNNIVFLFF